MTRILKIFVLPAGNLRESRRGAKRADIIVVTKCPEKYYRRKKQFYISRIKPRYYQKVFFSTINYDEEIFCFDPKLKLPDNNMSYYDILLITGIANPQNLCGRSKKIQFKCKTLTIQRPSQFYHRRYFLSSKEYEKTWRI